MLGNVTGSLGAKKRNIACQFFSFLTHLSHEDRLAKYFDTWLDLVAENNSLAGAIDRLFNRKQTTGPVPHHTFPPDPQIFFD